MSKKFFGRHVTAIDIGTTKICVIIAVVNTQGGFEILGIGHHPSYGLKKGVVVHIGTTVESIKTAIKEAEKMAGIQVESAFVGISGGHIRSFNSTGVVAVKGRDVSQQDVDRVIEAAKAIPLPAGQEILHVIPQYFRVDGQEYVLDSLGMYGVRLEAQVHIVTGAVASAQNIIKACELAGVGVQDIVLEQLASADAVLTDAEREMGVGILDIGGGTSDFAIYKDGRIRHSKVIPVAGNHFTNDIAVGLGIPFTKAEEIKRCYGTVLRDGIAEQIEEYVDVDLGYEGGIKTVQLSMPSEILRFRAEELFDLFDEEFVEFRLKQFMPAGLVLTGGGALLSGMKELASENLEMRVRIGVPGGYTDGALHSIPDMLKSPVYATGYGLLVYATGIRGNQSKEQTQDAAVSALFKRMKSWIYDFF
ncbi:cell division protein FtsA [Candidatus Dependentiae bacterium]|jgi:cell division protein FtsA|nr:cell division protein FtsA [Candidatus Dependentiae bacterium]